MGEDTTSPFPAAVAEPDPDLWNELLGKPGKLFLTCSAAVQRQDVSQLEENATRWLEIIEATDDTSGHSMAAMAEVVFAVTMALAHSEADGLAVDVVTEPWAGSGLVDPADDAVASDLPNDLIESLSEMAQQLVRDRTVHRAPEATFLWLLSAALEGVFPQERRRVDVPVLIDRAKYGQAASLRLTECVTGPAGIHPDPRRMFCFATDAAFRTALHTAWQQSPLAEEGVCVLWSLELDSVPVHEAHGPSLGAAVALALDELRRNRTLRGALRVLRIDRQRAISAELSPEGTLVAVDGIERKLNAAADAGLEVVLPEANREAVLGASGVRLPPGDTHYADSLVDAFRLVRTEIKNGVVRLAGLAVALVLVTSVVSAQYSKLRQGSDEARRQEVAARLLNEAALVEDDDPVLAELLALQSYEIEPSDRAVDYLFNAVGRNAALVTALFGHSADVTEVAMLAGGTRVVSADESGELRVWDLELRRLIGDPLQEHALHVRALAASPLVPQFVSGDRNGGLIVWDMPVDGLVKSREFRSPSNVEILDVSYSWDGTRIAAALSDGTVEIYHSDSGVLLARIEVAATADGLLGLQDDERLSGDIAPAVAFMPTGDILAGVGNNLLQLPVADGSVTRKRLPDASVITSIGVERHGASEGGGVFVGTDVGLVRWSPADDTLTPAPEIGSPVTDIEPYDHSLNSGRAGVIISTEDGSVLLDTETVRVQQNLGSGARGVAAVPNNPLPYDVSLVATAEGREVRLWDPASRGLRGEPVDILATEVVYMPDGRLVTGSHRGEVRVVEEDAVFDVSPGELWLTSVAEATDGGDSFVFDIDTNSRSVVISTASHVRPVEVLAVDTGEPIETPALDQFYRDANGGVRATDFTDDGKVLVTAAFDGRVAAWDTGDWSLLADYEGVWGVQALSIDPHGRHVAVANVSRGNFDDSEGGLLTFLDLESLALVRDPIPLDEEGLTDVEYIDRNNIAAGTTSGRVLTFNVSGDQPSEFVDYGSVEDWVIDLALSEKRDALTAVTPHAVYVMDPATGRRRGPPLSAPDMEAMDAAFSPDGDVLAVANFPLERDGPSQGGPQGVSIDQWQLDRTNWRAVACRHAGRDLTEDEWDTYIGGAITQRPTCQMLLRDEAQRVEAENDARHQRIQESTELEEEARDDYFKDIGDEPLVPIVTGSCSDLARTVPPGQPYDCGMIPGSQKAWLALPGDDDAERKPAVRFYTRLSSDWKPTGELTPERYMPYSTKVRVQDFGPWKQGEVLVTFVFERSQYGIVTDGTAILHDQSVSGSGSLTTEGSGLRSVDVASVGYEASCCASGRVTSLIEEVDGGWKDSAAHIMADWPSAYMQIDTDSLALKGDGLGDVKFSDPFDTALDRVRTTLGSTGIGTDDVAQPSSDIVWTDGIAAEAGTPWPLSQPLPLREVCWLRRTLCLYGSPPGPDDASAFVGWAYSVPETANEAPGAYDPLRLTTETDGYLGDPRRLMNDQDAEVTSEEEAKYDSMREISVQGQPRSAVVQAGHESRVRAIVAGWHRPVGAVPAQLLDQDLSPWQLDLMDYWSLVERDITDQRGASRRWHASLFGENGFGYVVEHFTVAEDRTAGVDDDIALASAAVFPPAPPEFQYRSFECTSGALAGDVIVQLGRTTGRPDRQWSVDHTGQPQPLDAGTPCS